MKKLLLIGVTIVGAFVPFLLWAHTPIPSWLASASWVCVYAVTVWVYRRDWRVWLTTVLTPVALVPSLLGNFFWWFFYDLCGVPFAP